MRDLKECNNCNMPLDTVYKEVVVVGNGPSGLSLSYMLAGHWPYYNGLPHPDEMLTARLQATSGSTSLLQEDLQFLSQGLEGRSNNPVSVLMDCLTHPGADVGLDVPQLVRWRAHPDRAIDHIVLGKGPPGGAWQAMDKKVLTISLSSWMELPGLEFRRWETRNGGGCTTTRRVPASLVAQYYKDYVRLMRLNKYFRSNVLVTSVRQVSCPFHTQELGCAPRWVVEGYDTSTNSPFRYSCRHVVLATGSTDQHNFLSVPGEHAHPSWVFHDLASFERAMEHLAKENPPSKDGVRQVDPVCVVGAGLSAADAVLAARFHSVPVLHLYRNSGHSPARTLPGHMYPEYHKVHQMMSACGQGYPDYTALTDHKVAEIAAAPDKKVTTVSPSGLTAVHQVSLLAVLIGSRPDLSFLPHEYLQGQAFTVDPEKPLDCRSNPLALDPWTHHVRDAPPGLYATGPLGGDNFVRFLLGGALACASDIYRHKTQQCCNFDA